MRAEHARWLESGGAEGARADFSGMELADVRFPGADLRRARFADANLFRADFAGADLSEADLHRRQSEPGRSRRLQRCSARCWTRPISRTPRSAMRAWSTPRWWRASLQRAWLGRAHLEHATLTRADLHGAWVGRASLEQANLEGAMLVGAEFPGTSFRGASLRSAYFGGVALVDADLSGADLGEVRNLTQTQLEAATVDERTILPPELRLGSSEARAAG